MKRPNKASDAKVDHTDSPSAENLTVAELNIESSQNETTGVGESKMLRVGLKRFYFDLGSNKKGSFLKISEVNLSLNNKDSNILLQFLFQKFFVLKLQVMNGYRSSVIIPLASVQQFHETVGHFIQNSNGRSAS